MDVKHYLAFLRSVLTPERFSHSLGVMQVMGELAGVYSLDQERAELAGLLHDAAKDMESERQMALAEEARIEFRYLCERDPLYLHGPVGAYVVSKELGVSDPVVLGAIAMHSWCGDGGGLHLPFLWCLRFADLLEPTRRDWNGKRKLKEIVYAGRMEEGALFETELLIKWFKENGTPVHPNMASVYKELSSKFGVR